MALAAQVGMGETWKGRLTKSLVSGDWKNGEDSEQHHRDVPGAPDGLTPLAGIFRLGLVSGVVCRRIHQLPKEGRCSQRGAGVAWKILSRPVQESHGDKFLVI